MAQERQTLVADDGSWFRWALNRLRDALFIRFLLVGVLNSAFGYGTFALLVWLGVHYSLALLLATVIGVLFNFKTTGQYVFERREWKLLWRFVLAYGVTYVFNAIGVGVLMDLGFGAYVAGAAMVLPAALLAFALNKRFVFEK